MVKKSSYDKFNKYMNKHKTKQRNSTLHLIQRFRERHNINLSAYDLDEIEKQLKNKQGTFVASKDRGRSRLFIVTCRGKEIVVVVDKGYGIKTTYPVDQTHLDIIEARRKFLNPQPVLPEVTVCENTNSVGNLGKILIKINNLIIFLKDMFYRKGVI